MCHDAIALRRRDGTSPATILIADDWPRLDSGPARHPAEDAMQGTVDRVVADEGFGFIIGPNGEEYFFHRSALKGTEWGELGPGVPVLFQVEEGVGDRPDEHLRAVDVSLASDAIPAVDNEPLPPGKIAGEGNWAAGN
jgi:cold shock CspA family protein